MRIPNRPWSVWSDGNDKVLCYGNSFSYLDDNCHCLGTFKTERQALKNMGEPTPSSSLSLTSTLVVLLMFAFVVVRVLSL